MNHAYRDVQCIVGSVAADAKMVARTRQQAESVLRAFLVALGWRIEFRWL